MRVSTARIKAACRRRRETVSDLLARAGVSRNAFYSLARADSVLPRSLHALAAALGCPPIELLTPDEPEADEMKMLLAEVVMIARRHARVDRDNVRHTLLALRRHPIDRLKTALARAA